MGILQKKADSTIYSDVLIIGSGIAGLRAALEVSRLGKRPLLISKSPTGKANNSNLAGGGFTFATKDFDFYMHKQRTLQTGKMLNRRDAVEAFVRMAPSLVKELLDMGMKASMRSTGIYCRGSSLVGGPEITSTLIKACQAAGVQYMSGIMVTDLLVDEGNCYGALGFQKRTGEIYGFKSDAVILATGGAGAIFIPNDNAPGITGDGYVLGLEAGLDLIDMEFVQFYPLVYAASGTTRMILPSSFADLGRILNRSGEDIKKKYDLREKPIAIVSRDRFAQALFREIMLGNGIDGALLLDMRGVDDELIPLALPLRERFKRKIAYHSKPLKIMPACHHTMGGILTDSSARTALEGLYAAGEVVGGIHGANRMGGNALSESMVFGVLAARTSVNYLDSIHSSSKFEILLERKVRDRFFGLAVQPAGPSKARALKRAIGEILWEKVGIIRSEKFLQQGIKGIDKILNDISLQFAENPRELCTIIECRNAALTARSIAVAALERKESRGAHYRNDFPEENEDWCKHIHINMVEQKPQINKIVPIDNL